MRAQCSCLLFLVVLGLNADEKYDGPVPAKPDVPYLLHAQTLTETESSEAREEKRKNETAYIVAGAGSTARTPLAEPIFIMDARKISPEQIELYRLEVKNGNREISMSPKAKKNSAHALHLMVARLGEHLYKIEVSETLDNGEYALSPSGENRVFCFEVY